MAYGSTLDAGSSFEREIEVLKELDHPFIPNYIDNFKTEIQRETFLALAQDYVKGEKLCRMVREGKSFTREEVLSIFEDLLRILDHIHNLHPAVIHRDVIPKNIVRDSRART